MGNETQRQRKSHGRFPSSGSWQPEEGCVSLPIRHRSEREGGSASQSINHTAPKNLANLWPVCHTGCTHNKAVCPPHSLVWGCNMRRRRNHGAFSGGKQDYVLRNAKRVTRKYTPNTLKYLRGIETQRTIFANQMGVFRDTRWTSANAELNTHTLTCQD